MQASGFPRLVAMMVVVIVLLCAVPPPTTAVQDDYVATELDDPLQPVWNRLDDLPRLVSDVVQSGLQSQFVALNRKIDTQMQSIKNSLAATTGILNRVEDDLGISDHFSPFISLMFAHISANVAEAVGKLELHIDDRVVALEEKLKEHLDDKFARAAPSEAGDGGGNTGSESSLPLSETLRANSRILENINTHVLKINEKIGGGSEGDDSCGTLVDKVSELMGASPSGSGGDCIGVNQQMISSITQQLRQSSNFLARDCSDIHWQEPESPSGVYEIFPTMDRKAPINAYCDMGKGGAKETGGWTVILRRRNSTWGLVNFNRTWNEYREGFGDPGEGEWWFGLGPLHSLTYRQPYEVYLLLHDIEQGTYDASYSSFRVEDETQNFKLDLNGFSGNVSMDALIEKHHGSSFSTWDKDNDVWAGGSCAQRHGGGWWFNACHYTTLTAPFPTSNDREARTIRWLVKDWLVLDDVTMKIRPVNYAHRFDAHYVG